MNNRNARIARTLLRIARELVAEETCYLTIDADGAHEVSRTEFGRRFASAARRGGYRKAGSGRLEPFQSSKAVFCVSPDINVGNDINWSDFLSISKVKGAVVALSKVIRNWLASRKHDWHGEEKIFDMIQKSQNSDRYPNGDNFALGATITTGRGLYTSTETGRRVNEKSYVITIYGITHQEAERLAVMLREYFEQESVAVEFTDYQEGDTERPGMPIDFVTE